MELGLDEIPWIRSAWRRSAMSEAPPIPRLREVVKLLRTEVVVVKNPDIWASVLRGGDWDLVARDCVAALSVLQDVLGSPVRVVRRSYVLTAEWPWGHVDLLPDIRWRGILLLRAGEILDSRIETPDLPVSRPAHEAIASCIFSALSYGLIKPRYRAVWDVARDSDRAELASRLADIFGPASRVEEWSFEELAEQATRLRRSARRRAWSIQPAGTALRYSEFAFRESVVRTRARIAAIWQRLGGTHTRMK